MSEAIGADPAMVIKITLMHGMIELIQPILSTVDAKTKQTVQTTSRNEDLPVLYSRPYGMLGKPETQTGMGIK